MRKLDEKLDSNNEATTTSPMPPFFLSKIKKLH